MTPELDPPFGTYALPAEREQWRRRASGYPDTRWGRAMISRCRKKALAKEVGPFDVEIDGGIKARLYPGENRCEKRAFSGMQHWDRKEREALSQALTNSTSRPFVFLDVGANVGIYSLHVHAEAMKAGVPTRILAIEPSIETCGRLENNINANAAAIQIIRAAVSDEPGSGHLASGGSNRGEAHLSARKAGETGEAVIVDTLPRICRANGLTAIDAMKVDIEGHDLKALTTFFEDATPALHPQLLILETGKAAGSPLIELCAAHGYRVTERTGLNTILVKDKHVET